MDDIDNSPAPMAPERLQTLKEELRARALSLGFVRCGFSSADPLPHADVLTRWLDEGMAAKMAYMRRSALDRADPRTLLPEAQSAIVVVASYARHDRHEPTPRRGSGRIARYARGPDYHRVLRQRLGELAVWLEGSSDAPLSLRVTVDTSPLLEREIAMRAGVGFIGKNAMLITPGVGSYTVLGVMLCSLPFVPDAPAKSRCGRCDRCLKACPTSALVAPYRVDGRSCISYLTIESRDAIPRDKLPKWGNWLFGCDDCQEVCPYNRPTRAMAATNPDPELGADPALGQIPLASLLQLRSGAYRRLVRGRSLSRTSRPCWIRNAEAVQESQSLDTASGPTDPEDLK